LNGSPVSILGSYHFHLGAPLGGGVVFLLASATGSPAPSGSVALVTGLYLYFHFLGLLNCAAFGQSVKCDTAGSSFALIGFMGMVALFGVNHSSMLAPHGHVLLA